MKREECEVVQFIFEVKDESEFLSRVRRIADEHEIAIICFNADLMAGTVHVMAALEHAARSFYGENRISNSFEMEALLYAAGTRQCQIASDLGIHHGENRCYVCFCPPCTPAEEELQGLGRPVDEDWEQMSEEKKSRLMERFLITPEEIETIKPEQFRELVVERVALLDVYR